MNSWGAVNRSREKETPAPDAVSTKDAVTQLNSLTLLGLSARAARRSLRHASGDRGWLAYRMTVTAAAASPSRRRARHHREPDPVSGMTPEARLSVPAGTPGKPGVPCSATSVPSSVVKPAPDNAETGVLEGVAQDGGTDIGPIEPARPALASTASCMLAAAPFSAELSAASIPNAPGANSAGFSLAAPKGPSCSRPR